MSFDAATASMMSRSDDAALLEAIGDLVPFSDYPQNDWPGGGVTPSVGGIAPFTTISDRADGKYLPIFQNEIDLAFIRGMARRVKSLTPFFDNALSLLRTYTMGNGPVITAIGKAKGAKPDENTKLLQIVLDAAAEQLQLPQLLDELHDRSREEGEALAILHQQRDDAHSLAVEIAEMDCLTEPAGSAQLHDWIRDEFGIDCDSFVPSWSFGILTGKRTTSVPLGYHVVYESGGADYEFYPADRVVHLRRNVPANVKRGVSDFLQIFKPLLNEDKLANNMGTGAAIQAAIAWIEEYATGATAAQAGSTTPTDILSKQATNIGNGGGTRSTKATHYGPGTIIRTSAGRQHKPGPLGAERNGNFELVEQLLLRRVGARWTIPEYMISTNAANANFASTLVSESPFVKAREADQEYMRRVTKSLLWKAVAMLWPALTGKPLEVLEQVRRHYEIKVDFPLVQSRDPLAMAQRLEIEKRNGWVSDQTAMSELGRDPDHEKSQGAKAVEQPAAPNPFGQLPMRGQPGPVERIGESEDDDSDDGDSLLEAFSEDDHPRDDNGRFVGKAKIAAAMKDPAKAAELRKSVTNPEQRKKLDKIIGTAGKAAAAVLNAPGKLAHAIDDMGTASVKNAETVRKAIQGVSGTKVADKSGKPIVVYHGTNADFDKFDLKYARPNDIKGVFFGTDEKLAGAFGAKRIVKATVDMKNPATFADVERLAKSGVKTPKLHAALQKEGFDGIYDPAKQLVVAFDPNQIHQIRESVDDVDDVASADLTPAQSAALQGALESVETTDEARAILESMTKAYP